MLDWEKINKEMGLNDKPQTVQASSVISPAVAARQKIQSSAPILRPTNFRNATAQTSISPEQQAANQQTAISELTGKNGTIASISRGLGVGIGTMGLRSFLPGGDNQPQEQAAAQNNGAYNFTPDVTNVRMGFKPAPQQTGTISPQGIGEFVGSSVGVDPIGLGIGKGISLFKGRALRAAEQIPTVVKPVQSELEKLAYESNLRKGKITPQNDTLYGNAPQPITGELPAPTRPNRIFNPIAKPLNVPEINAKPKDEYMQFIADKIASQPEPMWGNYHSQFGQSLKRQLDEFGAELDRVQNMTPEQWAAYARQNGITQNVSRGIPRIDKEIPRINQNPFINNANREVPRTITPNEQSQRFGRGLETPTRSPELTPQPRNPEKGTLIPKVSEVVPATSKVAQGKGLPSMSDNYLKPISEYTDALYHETDPKSALKFIDKNVASDMSPDIYFSNNKDMALGQGSNQGVIVQLEPNANIQGKINTSKPTWQMEYANNRAELIGRFNKQSDYIDSVKSITIKKNASMANGEKLRLSNALNGWDTIKNADGSTTYVKPQASTAPVEPRNQNLGAEIPKEQPFAQNGLKSVGADTFKGEKSIDQLVNEFGAIPKGEMPRAREVDVPKKTDYGQTQQYARTLQESAIVDDTLYKDINDAITQGSFTKPTKSNRTAVEDASRTIEGGLDESVAKFKSVTIADKKPTSYDIALGNRVLQELQKSGRYNEAVDVAIDLSEMLSETGRTLQAARIAKRLSPEGRLMIATRAAKKISKKTGGKVTLTEDTIKQISEAKTEKEITEANKKAAIEMWNQVPANWIDKVNSWRYMSMLLNPKTHIRNIVGNALFLPVREFKNLIGAGLEKAIIKDGERTKAVLTPADKELLDFAGKDFENVKSTLKGEGKYDETYRPTEARVFKSKALEGARKFNFGALDAEDTWFMKFAYDSSLAQYMKANKLNPADMIGDTLEKGRSYATGEALKATYRDANALASTISRGKGTLASGKYGPLGRAGGVALEGLVPFTKTPLNIIKRGVAYSPANLIRGIANLSRVKSGKVTATEAIDELASGLSGTALLALGTYLGYNNIVQGKLGDYKDKSYNYNQMIGAQNYSLNVDGNSYTIDWAAPLSMPFFVGVELAKAVKDGSMDLAAVLDSMTQISDPMVNLSMLKGINDIMTNNFEGLGQTAMDVGTGYAGQFVPTVGGQIARTIDDTRRSTISTAETGLGRATEKFGRKQLAKIPGLSKNLEPYIDLWGREQPNASAAENFLSPGYFKQQNLTPVDRELKSLMKQLDPETIKTIIPSTTAYQYTLEANSESYRMTEKESTQYQRTRGQESYKGLENLFASGEYQSMSPSDKAKAVADVYSDAGKTAKVEFLTSKGVSPTVILSNSQQDKYNTYGKNLGIDEQKFVEAFRGISDVKSDPGKLNVSRKKKDYIDSQFPNATKEQLRFMYEMADVSEKVGHYRRQFE